MPLSVQHPRPVRFSTTSDNELNDASGKGDSSATASYDVLSSNIFLEDEELFSPETPDKQTPFFTSNFVGLGSTRFDSNGSGNLDFDIANSLMGPNSQSPILPKDQQFEAATDGDLRFAATMDLAQRARFMDEALKWIPLMIPFIAYVMYDPTAEVFTYLLDALSSQNNWVAVDGGAYQAKIIAPAINGIIVPAISILFANLIGTTITTLRQRQLDIRNCLHMEAGQLRILSSLLDVFPSETPSSSTTSQAMCRKYLAQYSSRLIAESQPTLIVESLDYSLDTELNGILAQVNQWSSMDTSTEGRPNDLLLSNAFGACNRLYEERAKRITALRSLFPPLHFIIVGALAVSICMAFLLESKQDILVFLNAIQLRILWTMLVGTFTALAVVCYDLGNPFRGSYEISRSVHQLYTIRLALRASLAPIQQRQEQKVEPTRDQEAFAKTANGLSSNREKEQ